ncbi:MAG: hypothetical protein QOI10_994 [Solirubrobacterales bacterium]|jgi:hypothetical protein|nr:hypothetical protein [Solirubrobacterales bacterium]
MATTRKLSFLLALTACAAVFAPASPAVAERPLELGVTGYTDDLFSDPATQDQWLGRTVDAGAGMVVLGAFWDQIASSDPPANPANPADPSYSWGSLDASVRNATAHGLDVMIVVTGTPAWAEGPNRPAVDPDKYPRGTWKPDPEKFSSFAKAVTTRYAGNFIDPANVLAGTLPSVHLWEVWAEPNLWVNLTPQYEHGKEFAADHYRKLLNAFYDAAKGVSPNNTIVNGGLAPYGDPPGDRRTRPLAFYRDLLCLHGRKALKPTKCSQKPKLDVLADNPINLSGGPRQSAINPDDASSADLGNVAKVLRAAERHNTITPGGKHPLWATEFWWNSDPPHNGAIPLQQHARWIEEALYLYWKAGASVAINLRIRDTHDQAGVDGTGLYFVDGDPKPALTAFRFPFVTERRSGSKVRAWGRAPVAGKLVIERKTGKGWRKVDKENVGAQDVFTANLSFRGKAKLRARVGGESSLAWTQGHKIDTIEEVSSKAGAPADAARPLRESVPATP